MARWGSTYKLVACKQCFLCVPPVQAFTLKAWTMERYILQPCTRMNIWTLDQCLPPYQCLPPCLAFAFFLSEPGWHVVAAAAAVPDRAAGPISTRVSSAPAAPTTYRITGRQWQERKNIQQPSSTCSANYCFPPAEQPPTIFQKWQSMDWLTWSSCRQYCLCPCWITEMSLMTT